MPLVKIFLREGKNEQYVRALSDEIHSALVSEAGVPEDDRFQVIFQLREHLLVAHPSYAGMNRSADLMIIEITLNAGRTIEIKKNLYARICRNLSRNPGVRPDDVMISLIEVVRENWSFGKGIATYA